MNSYPALPAALSLAARGWHILPLRGKIPITPHGVKDATTDPARIRTWWTGGPRNIGARVPSAALVIDIDPQNGGSLEALEQAAGVTMPPTLTVHTGRGGPGQHRYYRHPGGPVSSTRLPEGIDVKTDKGYCVMPPSLHPATGNPYRWESAPVGDLPAKLIELLRPPPPRRLEMPSPTDARAQADIFAARAAYLARHVEAAPEGDRNGRLFWAACRAFEDGHPPETLELLIGAAMVAGLSESEASRTIASAQRTAARR